LPEFGREHEDQLQSLDTARRCGAPAAFDECDVLLQWQRRWRRCEYRRQHDAQAHVPRVKMQPKVMQMLRAVLSAPNRADHERLLKSAITACTKMRPKRATSPAPNVPARLTILDRPGEACALPHGQRPGAGQKDTSSPGARADIGSSRELPAAPGHRRRQRNRRVPGGRQDRADAEANPRNRSPLDAPLKSEFGSDFAS